MQSRLINRHNNTNLTNKFRLLKILSRFSSLIMTSITNLLLSNRNSLTLLSSNTHMSSNPLTLTSKLNLTNRKHLISTNLTIRRPTIRQSSTTNICSSNITHTRLQSQRGSLTLNNLLPSTIRIRQRTTNRITRQFLTNPFLRRLTRTRRRRSKTYHTRVTTRRQRTSKRHIRSLSLRLTTRGTPRATRGVKRTTRRHMSRTRKY